MNGDRSHSLAALIHRMQAREAGSDADFFRQFAPLVRRTVTRYASLSADIDDILIIAMTKAWRKIVQGRYRHDPAIGLAPWLRVLAKRETISFYRRARFAPSRPIDPLTSSQFSLHSSETATPEELYSAKEAFELARADLKPREIEALEIHVRGGPAPVDPRPRNALRERIWRANDRLLNNLAAIRGTSRKRREPKSSC